MREGGSQERPAVFFDDAEDFRAWLEAHHETETELWMGMRKKHVQPAGLQWAEAVREALCFGWIDSVAQRIDDDTRRQRWTPRKAGSNWSTVNITAVAELHGGGADAARRGSRRSRGAARTGPASTPTRRGTASGHPSSRLACAPTRWRRPSGTRRRRPTASSPRTGS